MYRHSIKPWLSAFRRRGFTLIELLVVVVIIGILASVALPSFVGAQDKARNSSVTANLSTVRMALEQYATDNKGSFPDGAKELLGSGGGKGKGKGKGGGGSTGEGLLQNSYLPGNRMPMSPWSKQPQAEGIKHDDEGAPGPSAKDVANGASPKGSDVINKRFGNGRVRADGPEKARDYGAILYDYDSDTQTYVLYAVGKRNKDAIVVTGQSNNGQ